MNSSALGPVTSTFGPSVRITAVFGALGLFPCLVAFLFAFGMDDRTAWSAFAAMAAVFVSLAVWQLSFRAAVHESGISCRNIFSAKEMPWNEIEGVYYSSLEVQLRFIPLGEFFGLRLRDCYGHSMSFTNHIDRHQELAIAIAQQTFKRLAEKAVHAFDSGNPVDFGAITVSRADGVSLNNRLSSATIEWQNLAGYEFDTSSVSFNLHKGFRSSRSVPALRIANVHVLKFLLDGITKRARQRA